MLTLLVQIFRFMRVSRKFWMGPLILLFFSVGAIVVLGQNTAVAPFIYALF